MSHPVSYEPEGDIGVITVNNPPVLESEQRFGAEAWAPAPLLARLATE